MDQASLDKLKVADLKKLLKERGLKLTGTKAELIATLLSSSENVIEQNEDDSALNELNEEELNEEALVPDISDTSLNTSTAVDQNESHLDASLGLDDDIALVKTQAKSAAPTQTVAEDLKKPSGENVLEARKQRFGVVSADVKKVARAERFGLNTNGTAGDIEKTKKRAERFGVVLAPKLVEATDSDKLKKRAEKFGVSSSSSPAATVSKEVDGEKLKSRAERFGIQAAAASSITKNGADVDTFKKRADRFGTVTATTLATTEDKEKLVKRKERFLGSTTDSDPEAKKLKRLERFTAS